MLLMFEILPRCHFVLCDILRLLLLSSNKGSFASKFNSKIIVDNLTTI